MPHKQTTVSQHRFIRPATTTLDSEMVTAQAGTVPPTKKKGLSRRALLGMIGASVATVTLAACRPQARAAGPQFKQRVQLVYQDCRCLGEQLLLRQFHADHPTIEVFYIPSPDNVEEQMLADMQAGVAPDVLVGCCETLPIWAEKGYLLDLRPYVEADLESSIISDWDPAQYNSLFSREGMQFALPKYHGALALYYNKDLFDAHGVAHPNSRWTHDNYLAAMKALTSKPDSQSRAGNTSAPQRWGSMLDISWERIQVHVNGWGGHLVDPEDPTKSKMAAPEALMAMEWIRARMWDDHVMANKLDVQNLNPRDAFIQGRVAMVEEGSWALKDILDGAKFRIGVAPFPAGPVRRVTLASTDGFAIYAGTQHPDAAWELMKFFIGRDYGLAMAESQLLQPARASLVSEWITIIQDQYPQQSAELELGAFAEGHIQGYSVTAEIFANMAEARRLTMAAWEEIFTLGQARVDLMKHTSAMVESAQTDRV